MRSYAVDASYWIFAACDMMQFQTSEKSIVEQAGLSMDVWEDAIDVVTKKFTRQQLEAELSKLNLREGEMVSQVLPRRVGISLLLIGIARKGQLQTVANALEKALGGETQLTSLDKIVKQQEALVRAADDLYPIPKFEESEKSRLVVDQTLRAFTRSELNVMAFLLGEIGPDVRGLMNDRELAWQALINAKELDNSDKLISWMRSTNPNRNDLIDEIEKFLHASP